MNILMALNITVLNLLCALRSFCMEDNLPTCLSLYFGNCNMTSKENFSFDIPQPKTKIGVQRQRDGTFHVFVNGEDQGVAAMDIPQVSC